MLLFIDCYDSFSFNLVNLLRSVCNKDVVVMHMDAFTAQDFEKWAVGIEGVVIGPGPGNPKFKADCGVIPELWSALTKLKIPVLGICFGFQSLVIEFGGSLAQLEQPVHGQICKVTHSDSELFKQIPANFDVVRYHSLFCESKELRNTAECDGVLMAVEHPDLPFYGVQFHPESIMSNYGDQMFQNFINIMSKANESRQIKGIDVPLTGLKYTPLMPRPVYTTPSYTTIELPKFYSFHEIAAVLPEFTLLKSQAHPGEWTIFGSLDKNTVHFKSKSKQTRVGKLRQTYKLLNKPFFEAVSEYMQERLVDPQSNRLNLPFLNGFMGYITYEGCCQEGLDLNLQSDMQSDLSWVYITNSVLINEPTQKVFVVGSPEFCNTIQTKLQTVTPHPPPHPQILSIQKPTESEYTQKIKECFEYLHSGDSYELCLTDQTKLDIQGTPWSIFCQILATNPAPYCSYMCFDDVLLSTSPERFVKFNNQKCEFRPIKGTVKKSSTMTLAKATEILRTPKEQAENLMIVDLIRHDLGQLLPEITCPELMAVEEYETVYQLVTSIEGQLTNTVSGIDVLQTSLPPGSMTGAPKLRSVNLLHQIEKRPRNLYSGVHGYWSNTNTGDWSVIIRSVYKLQNAWQIGAGGGVTVLSTPKGEFEEMQTKLDAVIAKLRSL